MKRGVGVEIRVTRLAPRDTPIDEKAYSRDLPIRQCYLLLVLTKYTIIK